MLGQLLAEAQSDLKAAQATNRPELKRAYLLRAVERIRLVTDHFEKYDFTR